MFINYYTVIQNQSDYIDVYLKNEVPKEINIAHDNMQYGYILVHVISYIMYYNNRRYGDIILIAKTGAYIKLE